jgi:hypothetical protein
MKLKIKFWTNVILGEQREQDSFKKTYIWIGEISLDQAIKHIQMDLEKDTWIETDSGRFYRTSLITDFEILEENE